ncbi:MAG: transglutaminase family protein [Acidimicrobiia bacterium]|nr:transglutaminase family protein [Acidimicrobiia bacterium]
MLISVSHTTIYRFEKPIYYGLQRLRLIPRSGPTQTVLDWNLGLVGADTQVDYGDHFGNRVTLIRLTDDADEVRVTAGGVVDTVDRAGVVGDHQDRVPLWLYRQATELTEPGPRIGALAESAMSSPATDEVARLHLLSQVVREAVDYSPGGTETSTPAEAAVAAGLGVCQDHAQIFAAAARLLDIPCRYVSGYLLVDEADNGTATHAWAEAWIGGLGWVGFDVSNGISTDDHYVRLAVGRDYREAAPISGLRYGPGGEDLTVQLEVLSQASQAQQ